MSETDDTHVEYGLVVSFEDQSHSYVHGWEAGAIWQRMCSGAEAEIQATVHTANRTTLFRMAKAEGWTINFEPTQFEEWLTVVLRKTAKAPDRPNPHGLYVVS